MVNKISYLYITDSILSSDWMLSWDLAIISRFIGRLLDKTTSSKTPDSIEIIEASFSSSFSKCWDEGRMLTGTISSNNIVSSSEPCSSVLLVSLLAWEGLLLISSPILFSSIDISSVSTSPQGNCMSGRISSSDEFSSSSSWGLNAPPMSVVLCWFLEHFWECCFLLSFLFFFLPLLLTLPLPEKRF